MNHNPRISLEDTTITMLTKLAEGNPGAISVLISLLKDGDAIDPDAALGGGLMTIFDLDSHGIYGSAIWIIYKDVCGQRLPNLMALFRACQLGLISKGVITDASRGVKVDTDAILKQVQEKLPAFAANAVATA